MIAAVERAGYAAREVAADADHDDADDAAQASSEDDSDESLHPLFLIVAYLAGAVFLVEAVSDAWSWTSAGRHFMAGFFLTFSFFKLLDLRGFFQTYGVRSAGQGRTGLGLGVPVR